MKQGAERIACPFSRRRGRLSQDALIEGRRMTGALTLTLPSPGTNFRSHQDQ